MLLSDRITAMYSRSPSCLSIRDDKNKSGLEEKSCKIRFLPGLITPDCGPIHQPSSGAGRTTSILKRTADSCPTSVLPADRYPTRTAILPAAVGSSDERFLRELQASKILADRRNKAISKLQARVRMSIQRKQYMKLRTCVRRPEIRATTILACEAEDEPTTANREDCEADGDLYVEINRLERKLELIKRQQQEEMEQIERWKIQEMKRIRDEAELSVEISSQLSAQFKANRRCIRALRLERKAFQEENESLQKDMLVIRNEQRQLLVESEQLKGQAETLQRFVDAESKRNEDWSRASMQYEGHVAHAQSMVAEREARALMEEHCKNLYCQTVLKLARRLGSQQDLFDRNTVDLELDSIDSVCTLLYAA